MKTFTLILETVAGLALACFLPFAAFQIGEKLAEKWMARS